MQPCMVPIATLAFLSVATNAIMLFRICKKSTPEIKIGFHYGFIAVSNLLLSVLIGAERFLPHKFAFTGHVISRSLHTALTLSFMFMTLGANLALALKRLKSITDHHISETPMQQEKDKKFIISVSAVCVAGGFICGIPSGIFDYYTVVFVYLSGLRVGTNFVLCVVYLKIWLKFRATNRRVAAHEQSCPPIDAQITERKKAQEKHLGRLFTGITGTFFVLQFPSIVVFLVLKESPDCSMVAGRIFSFALSFLMVAAGVDPIWFFYSEMRLQRNTRKSQSVNTQV